MTIRKKIINSTVLISLFSIVITTTCIIWQSNKLSQFILFNIAKDRLANIRYFKTLQVETYFNDLMDNLLALSKDEQIIKATKEFSSAFPKYLNQSKILNNGYKSEIINNYINSYIEQYKYYNVEVSIDPKKIIDLISENSFALQYNYIFNNSYGLSYKDQLNSVNDGTQYSLAHQKYHPSFVAFKQQFDFYDIFLVDAKTGDIIYSVNKEIDFATSLLTGTYSKSGLGIVFNKVVNNKSNFIAITDFSPYLASYDNQAAFIGTGIFDNFGNKTGVLIIQLSVEHLNNIMTNGEQWEKIGLGKTVNAVIVGPDYRLRTSNRFFVENRDNFLEELQKYGTPQKDLDLIKVKNSIIGILKTDTLAVRQAFSGIDGFTDYIDYRKIPVIGSFAPLKINGLNWVIVVKMNKTEALSWIKILNKRILLDSIPIIIIIAIIAILLGIKVANNIMIYINKITREINDIAQSKDLTKRIKILENNEFTVMINALNDFISSLHAILKNIVHSANKSKQKMHNKRLKNENNSISEEDNTIKTDIFNLNEQINELSNEFKIMEEENERTKYW